MDAAEGEKFKAQFRQDFSTTKRHEYSKSLKCLSMLRDEGHGRGDEKNWEGDAPAEPERQRMANSEWQIVFLDGNDHALLTKVSVVREHDPPVKNSQNAK